MERKQPALVPKRYAILTVHPGDSLRCRGAPTPVAGCRSWPAWPLARSGSAHHAPLTRLGYRCGRSWSTGRTAPISRQLYASLRPSCFALNWFCEQARLRPASVVAGSWAAEREGSRRGAHLPPTAAACSASVPGRVEAELLREVSRFGDRQAAGPVLAQTGIRAGWRMDRDRGNRVIVLHAAALGQFLP